MAVMRMAKVVLLLVVLIQVVNVLGVSAARPAFLRGERWLDDGIQMVVGMLGDNKSGTNPPSHCCN
ncbi:hypothetical protein BS78_06G055200 [Paspalum vaginatum]|nr:hypothetical protein BS78_06G055200 [Paspalum vaginatum]